MASGLFIRSGWRGWWLWVLASLRQLANKASSFFGEAFLLRQQEETFLSLITRRISFYASQKVIIPKNWKGSFESIWARFIFCVFFHYNYPMALTFFLFWHKRKIIFAHIHQLFVFPNFPKIDIGTIANGMANPRQSFPSVWQIIFRRSRMLTWWVVFIHELYTIF